jgi:hypothetical protein
MPMTVVRNLNKGLLILGLALSAATNNPRLVSFHRDAEKAIGKHIDVIYAADVQGGQTECNLNPVRIKIGTDLTQEIQELALAHELGHVIVCSRKIGTDTYTLASAPAQLKPILGNLGSFVSSCYIDPLAHAEGEIRGFRFDKLEAYIVDHMKHATVPQSTSWAINRDFKVLAIYCVEVRQKRSLPDLENTLVNEPDVLNKLQSVKSKMGFPACDDGTTCYYLTKRLRDQFTWANYVLMKNPTTGEME